MRAAVCCPGPSLLKRWPGHYGYEGIWAVNRALLVIPNVDWLSAGDMPLYMGLLGDHRPAIGANLMDDIKPRVIERGDWNGVKLVGWNESPMVLKHTNARSITWSVQVALLHACELGAKHIDLYGCDGAQSGQVEDCTGYPGEDRTLERWKKEETDLHFTFAFIAGHGTKINRVPP